MNNNYYNSLVSIRCWTFNHHSYIRQCLDGFVLQKTNFPFTAIVVDDASTDNEQDVLWDFIINELDTSSLQKDETEDYVRVVAPHKTNINCIFLIILLKYNHYSIRKAKYPYFKGWEDSAKYIAICEGDDYWTDPMKLQKQVNVMKKHPECTMCCSNGFSYSETDHTSFLINPIPVEKSRFLSAHEVFLEENALIPTCSMCYRKEIADSMPDFFKKAPVGDRPIRMWCAINGKIFYHQEPLITYRYGAIGCYTQRVKRNSEFAKRIYDGMTVFFNKFDELTNHKYHDDVEYMKDREAYIYYRNTANNRKVLTSKFLMNYPFKKRTIIRLKCIVKLIPGVYPLYKLISKQS